MQDRRVWRIAWLDCGRLPSGKNVNSAEHTHKVGVRTARGRWHLWKRKVGTFAAFVCEKLLAVCPAMSDGTNLLRVQVLVEAV